MTYPENIRFSAIQSEYIRNAFYQAYQKYPELHTHPITLRKMPIKSTTMRAQPIINAHFWNREKRHYRIDISNSTALENHVPIADLPEKVLIGWFAHELGHVMDYQQRSVLGMIRFGIGYLLMPTYRIGAERQADIYAIEHGFAEFLIATKTFILEQSTLPDYYKKRIQKYYMSPDEIAILLDKQEPDQFKMDKVL